MSSHRPTTALNLGKLNIFVERETHAVERCDKTAMGLSWACHVRKYKQSGHPSTQYIGTMHGQFSILRIQSMKCTLNER
eukprot:scaffold169950_cov34-Tisochrysis_lutea.AAC.1